MIVAYQTSGWGETLEGKWWNKRLWGKYFVGSRETRKDTLLVHNEEEGIWAGSLTLSWRSDLSYRNQSIDLQSQKADFRLYCTLVVYFDG